MNFILGKKIKMTQIFSEDGKMIPVTEVKVDPNTIIRVKEKEKDGYQAVVLACGTRNKIKKSLLGLFKKWGKFRYIKEFRTEEQEINLKPGDQIGLNIFNEGDKVKVTAISKGKGFQGVVKRHGFSGTDEQHGNKDQSRMPGSIGATGPAHVFKGTRMGGRMGGDQVTISGLEIIKIDLEKNLLYIKGSVAGGNNALVSIKGEGELKIYEKPVEKKVEDKEIKEEVKKEDNSIENEIEDKKIEEKKEISKEEKVEEKKDASVEEKKLSSAEASDGKEDPESEIKEEAKKEKKEEKIEEKKEEKK